MSRPRKFPTEFLINIVDEYIEKNQIGQVKAADLARYAVQEYKLSAMDDKNGGRFFKNDADVDKYIKDINHHIPNYKKKSGKAMIELAPEKFMKQDRKVQMVLLRSFADSYNDLNREIIAMKAAEINYKDNIEKLKIENKKIKEKFKDQVEILEKKNEILKTYKAIKHFVDNVNMLEYLKSKGSFHNIDEKTFLIVLNKMENILGSSILNLDDEIEYDICEGDNVNKPLDNNSIEEALGANKLKKPKLIDFVEEKAKKNSDVANLLEEFKKKTT